MVISVIAAIKQSIISLLQEGSLQQNERVLRELMLLVITVMQLEPRQNCACHDYANRLYMATPKSVIVNKNRIIAFLHVIIVNWV